MLNHINFSAVAVASLVTFVVGAFWYSQSIFGGIWGRESGLVSRMLQAKRHPVLIVVGSYVLGFIAATVIAKMLGPNPGLAHAIRRGAAIGGGVAATSFGINYLFGNRSFKLWLVDAGYHVVQFALMGGVLGLMM